MPSRRRLRVAEASEATTAYHWATDVLLPVLTRATLQPASTRSLDQRVHELAVAAKAALDELEPDAIYRDVGAFVDYVSGRDQQQALGA